MHTTATTAVDTAAANVLAAAHNHTATVDAYHAYQVDATAVRSAGKAVTDAHRRMLDTRGDLNNCDAYLAARRAARTARRTTANIVAAHVAGHPDR